MNCFNTAAFNQLVSKIQLFSMLMGSLFLFALPDSAAAQVTYTINKTAALDASTESRLKIIIDSAVALYCSLTTITKEVRITYEPSVQTADGNINGSIRFGSNKKYQVTLTAMHEIAHTIGIGTTTEWKNLTNDKKVYTGKRATAKLKEVLHPDSILKGDDQHFWPYGLNYDYEVKSSKDLINHCKIVNEIYYDMFPQREPPKTGVAVRTIVLSTSPAAPVPLVSLDGRVVMRLPVAMQGAFPGELDNRTMRPGCYILAVPQGKGANGRMMVIGR